MAKVFHDSEKSITSLDFDDSGEYCVTASGEEAIHLYDCKLGTTKKTLYSKKYGVHIAKFAHTQNTVIHSSTKEDNTIRYLSLHDNQYIRYFKGHKKRVVSMSVSSKDDFFLSGALDDTVRLWDLRSHNCQGEVHVQGAPSVAFDPLGIVFAIALSDHTIRLYDVRNFDKGPFGMFDSSFFDKNDDWADVKFSNNGRDILMSTKEANIYVLDSVDYKLRFTLNGFENKNKLNLEASFTPDGKFVLSGSQDGKIHVWSSEDGKHVTSLEGHSGPVTVTQFNPRYLMMASGCSNLSFWLPYM